MISLTFDVEERFHSHLTGEDSPRTWQAGDQIARTIDLLEAHGQVATFFVVGELAERYPALIRRMVAVGCEVASHSHTHLKMDRANRRACEGDIERSKKVLEDISGQAVVGYRSPTWTAQRTDDWLWDHLIRLGFRYDSSLFPFRTHLYGSFANPVEPFQLRPTLVEIPPSVATWGPLRLPYGGGFYLRLFPMWLTRWLLVRDQRRSRVPIVYVHPWELDSHLDETVESGWLNRLIGTYGGNKTWQRLAELARDHRSTTMREHAVGM